jgi:hypothetical protein
MRPKPRLSWKILQGLWVVACLFVLGRSLAYRNGEAQEFEFYTMLALSYPLSLLAMWGYAAMLNWIPSDGVAGIALMWCFFFAVGCFQWIVAAPFVIRKLRRLLSKPDLVSVVPKE